MWSVWSGWGEAQAALSLQPSFQDPEQPGLETDSCEWIESCEKFSPLPSFNERAAGSPPVLSAGVLQCWSSISVTSLLSHEAFSQKCASSLLRLLPVSQHGFGRNGTGSGAPPHTA